MSCGGRVYKGDSVTISVPFDVEGYSNLVITYSTIGDAVIEKTQEEVTIEDGFITYTFDGHELDILPDGVIYYTISYQIDGVEHVESTNTPIYLATPAGYSGLTADEIYQSGYTAGLNDCSGDTPCDCTSAVTQAYQSGYTAGYESGYEDGEEDCPSLQSQKNVTIGAINGTIVPDYHYDAMRRVSFNAQLVYNSGYQSGYSAGQADCSGTTDCSSAITEAYESGYTAGQADCSGSCLIQAQKTYSLDPAGDGTWTAHADGGYDGVAEIVIKDNVGYGQSLYTSGYAAGLAACSGGCNLIADTNSLNGAWGGRTTYYPPAGYDGFSEMTIYDNGYGNSRYNDGRTAGFSSGYTSGFTDGYSEGCEDGLYRHCNLVTGLIIVPRGSTGTMTRVTPPSAAGFSSVYVNATGYGQEKYESGYTEGYNSGYTAGQEDCPDTCNIENDRTIRLNSDWTGETVVEHAEGYDGMQGVTVQDGGYGQAKYESGYTVGYDEGYLSGASTTDCSQAISMAYNNGRIYGYTEGKDSVIKTLLTENDTDLVIAYYYTSATQLCLITGEYDNYDGNSSFVSMSVNGYSWQPVEKYLTLQAGWTQIRFSGCTSQLNGTFSHSFTPSRECYMDALKIVSLPSFIDGQVDTHTFHANDGLRVIASSCGIMRGVTSGADNINVLITHYKGNQREYQNFPSSGVLFIPEGSSEDWSSVLSNWLHIEMV